MSTDRSFVAAMVQMRTSLLAEPSLEQGTRLIRKRWRKVPNTSRRPK